MSENFDLLGDPVPAGWGKRGRPQHIPTQQNRSKVMMLLAFGWNNERIARALSITPPTLRKNYFRELRVRAEARDRMEAGLAYRLWVEAMEGNVGAAKEFHKIVERNDMMLYGRPAEDMAAATPKPAKLGKKDRALQAARSPDTTTPLGELMAARDAGLLN